MNSTNVILKIISIFADSITIIGLIWAIIYGFMKKDQSLLGFRIHKFVVSFFKTGIIVIIGILIFRFSEIIYNLALILTKGSTSGELWDENNIIAHLISYFISLSIGLPLLWFISTFVWTGSLAYFRNIWSKEKINLIENQFNNLIIESAIYKTQNKYVDVTDKLRKMIDKGELTVTSSNAIAGDPDPGVKKILEIKYRYGKSELKTLEIPEKETRTIRKE